MTKVAADLCLNAPESVCEAMPYLLGREDVEVSAMIRQGFKNHEARDSKLDVEAVGAKSKLTLPTKLFEHGFIIQNTFIDHKGKPFDEETSPASPPARSKSVPTFFLMGEDPSDSEIEERSNIVREIVAGEKPQSNESWSMSDEQTPRIEECTPHLSRVSSYQSFSSKCTNSTQDQNEEHMSPKIPIENIERRQNGSCKVTLRVSEPFLNKHYLESEDIPVALPNSTSEASCRVIVLPPIAGSTFKKCSGRGHVQLTCKVAPEKSSMMHVWFSVGEGKKGKQKPLGPVPFVPQENASCCLPEGQRDLELRASLKGTEANKAKENRKETKKTLVISLEITPVQ